MGMLAAEVLTQRIANPDLKPEPFVQVEPELIVRESTAEAVKQIGARSQG
jgi:DNA-binding LacI/PurR family transcriptional regulator